MTGVGVEVLGVIAVGVGTAAFLFAMLHALRKAGLALPRWLLPAGIGLAMIGYSVWNDYAWYDRAVARLPDGARVLMVGTGSVAWAPWTYLAPLTLRFAALDPATITDRDGIRRAEILLVERRGQTLVVPQDFDCAAGRIKPARGDWVSAAPDDPVWAVVCQQGGGKDGPDPGDRG
ncbi:MAG: hypothetical protein ACU0DB_12210 [Paracoccus sp. (in: a-proteobacteria)]|jgi:hypothetical protein|uniref:hypothetical protein n=1 Tax=unclassified Paracoccus (in: a-proteobacteria) TaxID=2688777 RepID=UPI000C640B68|nr:MULTISPECIES: hypothetical protein [unclassified Paracoccus (in: a-proteobacteria)]MAN57116.1 hypothetical protein [Paracoccus sp. (in: a-proteobacteria)]MBA50099.1 hypothetical protein [Paracoccus sp. (in: a-proteobacteria)]|tara:strand:- start:859 stop:1386 length:528 start_codon:yes stop_codon:yes gene_type:complete